jgi:lipid-A-disaccharide synthase
MRIFISAGEPSGDLHGANLIRSLQRARPDVECVGFGGPLMEAAGGRLLYPLCQLAVMWLWRVLANFHLFLNLLSRADRYFRHQRPDAVILIDYPGFNWWIARRAHFHGIPVYYFVPPQIWAWASWRVKKMQRFVDHVLCALPFEEAWYHERGVSASYVGHPYFDELPQQRPDEAFLNEQRQRGGPIIGILPGSRTQEVDRNIGTLLRSAARVHAARPDVRFLVASFREKHQDMVAARLRKFSLPIEVHIGRTPEIIELAHACAAVSGSVSLELLYRGKPTAIIYRLPPFDLRVGHFFKKSRYITLVNMLADAELFPEYLTDRCESEAISGHLLRWLNDPSIYTATCRQLAALREKVAEPGACERTAEFVLSALAAHGKAARAA